MKNKISLYECPQRCSGKDSSWQHQLKRKEADKIKTEDNDLELSGTVMKCRYCKCVYRHNYSDHVIEILGRYDEKWERKRRIINLE